MKCILIFDQLNDILYVKCNKNFVKVIWKQAVDQGLIIGDTKEPQITANIIIQLFSPIVTSQRVMTGQFGNSYSSIQCDDGTNMVFHEYMGYLFIQIGMQTVPVLTKSIGICTSYVKFLCGPNVPLLRSSPDKAFLLTRLLDTWQVLHESDQAVLVESIEQLMVNADLSTATIKALKEAVDKLIAKTDLQRAYALVLVENKFLSLYSSRGAQDLAPSDVLFLGLLTESLHLYPIDSSILSSSDADSESSDTSVIVDLKMQMEKKRHTTSDGLGSGPLKSFLILLGGSRPHALHIGTLADGVSLLLMFECSNEPVAVALNDVFHAINALQNLQNQKDMENVRHAFEFLDNGMKRIFDGLRKVKTNKSIDNCARLSHNKWDFLRKKYIEFIKNPDPACLMRIESSTSGFVDGLKSLHKLVCFNESVLLEYQTILQSAHKEVKQRLQDFSEFLRVKALRNVTLGSRASLTINKYLEEFPGLVHFLYIDRKSHRLTAPSLDFSSEETTFLTKKKIWFMVNFVRMHLQEGYLSMMWKDTTFNYSYFLWFEDNSGSPLKPKISPTSVIKHCPQPGIIADDFYKRLAEACFPKMNAAKVHVYELYCVHLGLATSSSVLEHSRRLAATIWEVTGVPSNPTDFL